MTTASPSEAHRTGGLDTVRQRAWETTTRDTLYDPFCGSGTAVVAAEKTGRTCVAMDLDPQYIHVTRTRWEAFTGQRARPLPGGRRATGGSDA